jgi:hypothetical protein
MRQVLMRQVLMRQVLMRQVLMRPARLQIIADLFLPSGSFIGKLETTAAMPERPDRRIA